MNISLEQIKNWYNKLLHKNESYKRGGVIPEHDWAVVLSISVAVLCILAVFAFYFYIQIEQGAFFVTPSDISENKIKVNADLLNKTVDDINARQAKMAYIENNKPDTKDPSI